MSLNTKTKNSVIKSVNSFNEFIKASKEKNDDIEVGVLLDRNSTWPEKEHYTQAEFNDKTDEIEIFYWETTKPGTILSDVYRGLNEYDEDSLKQGIKIMKKIMNNITKELSKENLNENANTETKESEDAIYKRLMNLFKSIRKYETPASEEKIKEIKQEIIDFPEGGNKDILKSFYNILVKNRNANNKAFYEESVTKELTKLIESYTGKKVILKEAINLNKFSKYFGSDEDEFEITNDDFKFDYNGFEVSFPLSLSVSKSGVVPNYDFSSNQEYYDDEVASGEVSLESLPTEARIIYLLENVFKTEDELTKFLEGYYEVEIEEYFDAMFEKEQGDLSSRGLSWRDFI